MVGDWKNWRGPRRGGRRRTIAFIAALVVALVTLAARPTNLGNVNATTPTATANLTRRSRSLLKSKWKSPYDDSNLIPRPVYKQRGSSPLLFTCPDGRKGLHLVHIRLLLGQTEERGAHGTFRAGRLLLFRDFSLPGLARATAQSYLLYVSYDLRQDFPFAEASHDILRHSLTHGASYLYMPEKAWSYTVKAHNQLAFPRIADLLVEQGLASRTEMDEVKLYVTSRLDNDDAVHVDAIRLTQETACSHLGPNPYDRLFVSYVEPKLFWLPDPRHPYGQLATVRTAGVPQNEINHQRHVLKFKPILQSLGVHESLLRCTTPLNCYTHKHYEPAFINYARNRSDCPWEWDVHHNLKIIRPADGAVGALYSRTPGSWYNDINDRGFKFLDMNVDAIKGCGVNLGELAATNLLLGMLYKEAPKAASLSADATKGFGGIGSLFTKQAARDRAEKEAAEAAARGESVPQTTVDEMAGGTAEDLMHADAGAAGEQPHERARAGVASDDDDQQLQNDYEASKDDRADAAKHEADDYADAEEEDGAGKPPSVPASGNSANDYDGDYNEDEASASGSSQKNASFSPKSSARDGDYDYEDEPPKPKTSDSGSGSSGGGGGVLHKGSSGTNQDDYVGDHHNPKEPSGDDYEEGDGKTSAAATGDDYDADA